MMLLMLLQVSDKTSSTNKEMVMLSTLPPQVPVLMTSLNSPLVSLVLRLPKLSLTDSLPLMAQLLLLDSKKKPTKRKNLAIDLPFCNNTLMVELLRPKFSPESLKNTDPLENSLKKLDTLSSPDFNTVMELNSSKPQLPLLSHPS